MTNENDYKNRYKESLETISKLESELNVLKQKYEQLVIVYNKKEIMTQCSTSQAIIKEARSGIKKIGLNKKKVKDNEGNIIKKLPLTRYERLKRKAIKKPYLFFADSKFFFLRPLKFFYRSYNPYTESGKAHIRRVKRFCAIFFNDYSNKY